MADVYTTTTVNTKPLHGTKIAYIQWCDTENTPRAIYRAISRMHHHVHRHTIRSIYTSTQQNSIIKGFHIYIHNMQFIYDEYRPPARWRFVWCSFAKILFEDPLTLRARVCKNEWAMICAARARSLTHIHYKDKIATATGRAWFTVYSDASKTCTHVLHTRTNPPNYRKHFIAHWTLQKWLHFILWVEMMMEKNPLKSSSIRRGV